jgi:subtilisin family serine protease
MLLAALLVSTAFGLAPLLTQRETIDRVSERGVDERSYFVMFNDRAPIFEFQAKEKVKSWLPNVMPGVNVEGLQHVYNIHDEFRGISIWLDAKGLETAQSYEGTKYVEEDQVMRASAWSDRADWGQMRSTQRSKDLTNNGGYYASSGTLTYGPGGACDVGSGCWDWNTSAKNTYRLINTGSNAKVWIVDTGVLQTHSEFNASGRSRVVTNQDYVNASQGGTDCNGHGTHCAGSAAGRYRGFAVGADIGNVRVLSCAGSGTNANVVAGFNYVANNRDTTKANILSASLGGGASQTTDDAINNGARAPSNIIPVVAAGNDNANACNYSPARATSAITVGATQAQDARASFSNIGTCVTVFAPGQNIHSGWYTSTTAYNTISGTSMATPLVAGAIALWATAVAGPWTNITAKNAIEQFGPRNQITNVGTGSPNIMIYSKWANTY